MTVTLNIQNDAELRSHIKEAIKGQVRSLAREEVLSILKEVILEKSPDVDVNAIVRSEVVRVVNSSLNNNSSWNKPSYIQEIAREEVGKLLKDLFEKGKLL